MILIKEKRIYFLIKILVPYSYIYFFQNGKMLKPFTSNSFFSRVTITPRSIFFCSRQVADPKLFSPLFFGDFPTFMSIHRDYNVRKIKFRIEM